MWHKNVTILKLIHPLVGPDRAAPLMTTLLLLFVGYSLARLSWQLRPLPQPLLPPVTPVTPAVKQSEPVTLERVQTMHLFGEPALVETTMIARDSVGR